MLSLCISPHPPVMKRIIRLIVPIILSIDVTASGAVTPPVRIMPLGDSLTAGFLNDVTPSLGGYRGKLNTLLGSTGYNVDFVGTQTGTPNLALPDPDHEGHGGYRIDQIDAGIEGWLSAINDPDVILLCIGTNDFWQSYNTAGAAGRLDSLVTRIAALRPYAKILLATLPLRTDDPVKEAAQSAYNAAIPGIVSGQVAMGRQVYFVDMHASFNASVLSSDGVHPNQTGYDQMADTWLPAVTKVISPLGTTDPPAVVRVIPINLQRVVVTFSKPVEDAAASLDHFSLSGGAGILQATLDPETKRDITLTTSQLAEHVTYTLAVSGVRDRTPQQNEIAPGATAAFMTGGLANGSFETGAFVAAFPDVPFDHYELEGWTVTGNPVGFLQVLPSVPATDGGRMAIFNGANDTFGGTISQSFATHSGNDLSIEI